MCETKVNDLAKASNLKEKEMIDLYEDDEHQDLVPLKDKKEQISLPSNSELLSSEEQVIIENNKLKTSPNKNEFGQTNQNTEDDAPNILMRTISEKDAEKEDDFEDS